MPELLYNRKANATLANLAAGGRFPHTLLIEGPEGSGKKTAAWQIAKTLLCEGEPKPCGSCSHCVKADKRVHPDVRYYTVPEAVSYTHLPTRSRPPGSVPAPIRSAPPFSG